MPHIARLTLTLALCATTVASVAAQDAPPAGAFRAVHLVSFTPREVALLQEWIADMNATIAKLGHKEVRYRLFKVTGKQSGKYDFMWESSWPSGDVYNTIHRSPEWKAVAGRHPGLDAITKDEIYNRYVELTSDRR